MSWDAIVWIPLLILGLASIGGGLVLYTQSRRVGWRAVGMTLVAGGVAAVLVVGLTVPVSTSGETPEPVIVGNAIQGPSTQPQTTEQQLGGTVSTGMMVPRPQSAGELVARADIIVLGTIDLVLQEQWLGSYGEDGMPLAVSEENGIPVTDYVVKVEDVLKGDGTVRNDGRFVLRMTGHLSDESAIITPNVFALPNPGDRLLFALGRNPDDTYGSGPEGLLKVDGDKVVYIDDAPFATDPSPEQLMQDIRGAIPPSERGATTVSVVSPRSSRAEPDKSRNSEPVMAPQGYIGTLLFPAEVSELAGVDRLTTRYRDQRSFAASVDPSQVENMDSFDSLSFETADRTNSLSLTTIDFSSEGDATDRLDLIKVESGMLNHNDNIGDSSAALTKAGLPGARR